MPESGGGKLSGRVMDSRHPLLAGHARFDFSGAKGVEEESPAMRSLFLGPLIALTAAPLLAGPATAWTYQCRPEGAELCAAEGCAPSAAPGRGFRLSMAGLVVCVQGRCVRDGPMALALEPAALTLTGDGTVVALNRQDRTYTRTLTLGDGSLVEHGRCSGG